MRGYNSGRVTQYSIGAGKSAGSEITALFPLMQVGQNLAATGTGASSGCAGGWAPGTSISQTQPSLMQARTVPVLLRFSTMNAAPHFGHGSARGMWGDVKSQSG